MRSLDVAKRFVERINAHDVDGLVELMTEDHVFVDSMGDKSARPRIEAGWGQYFEMVPDYWIKIDQTVSKGNTVILMGSAGGTYISKGGSLKRENRWKTPAVWVARVRGRKIAAWRIYCDNEPIRARMRKSGH